MKRYRKISLILLSISSLIGLVRGYRMTMYHGGNTVILAYPQDVISDSVFSNYVILGWILFTLVGVFSVLTIVSILTRIRNYAYLIIVEGIFALFFVLTHILLTEFLPVHLMVLPICISLIVLGVLQTPREF